MAKKYIEAEDLMRRMYNRAFETDGNTMWQSGCWVRYRAIEAVVKETPAADVEPRWIPVTERLPKKDGRYQVTRHDYVTNTEFIDILWYEKNIWWNGHQMGDYAVTAWMPLPEPYKGNEE